MTDLEITELPPEGRPAYIAELRLRGQPGWLLIVMRSLACDGRLENVVRVELVGPAALVAEALQPAAKAQLDRLFWETARATLRWSNWPVARVLLWPAPERTFSPCPKCGGEGYL